jgi:hypothetical protein
MRLRITVVPAALLFIVGCAPSALEAQAPQTYSFTEDPGFPLAGPNVTKIFRDGSREVVEQTMPAGFGGREKEYRSHLLYDFQAHKLYTQVLSDPGVPCGLQDYADASAPAEFDPISGSDALQKELAGAGHLTTVGSEAVNGIPAKIAEATTPQGKGRVWLAQDGGFPVKVVFTGPDNKPETIIEVKQLSFAKPPASVFVPPAGCVAVQTAQTAPKPSNNVTAVTLKEVPNYTGACPAHIKMEGTITADGAGAVFYQFGAGKMEPGETVSFDAAGTKTVTHVITLQPSIGNDMGVYPNLVAIGADAAGNHGTPTTGANNSGFKITCTSGGGK